MIDYLGLVREFSVKAMQPIGRGPLTSNVIDAERELRIKLMFEELDELTRAMIKDDRAEIADGLADLLYVVFGTAVTYGMPMDELYAEVHRSNMTKSEPGERAPGAKYGERGGKGPSYKPPRIERILQNEQAIIDGRDPEGTPTP